MKLGYQDEDERKVDLIFPTRVGVDGDHISASFEENSEDLEDSGILHMQLPFNAGCLRAGKDSHPTISQILEAAASSL